MSELLETSYILGQQVGRDLSNQEIEIDFKTFFNSIENAYQGKDSKYDAAKTQEIMARLQEKLQTRAESKAKELGAANQAASLAYLQTNKEQSDITTTASGLQYKVLKSGNSEVSPSLDSTVETHYEGRLLDGTVFDSSYQRGESTSFPVNQVIAGWTEALQLMKEGDVWELTIPSVLAYGSQGAGELIGPNAALIFKVELIKVS